MSSAVVVMAIGGAKATGQEADPDAAGGLALLGLDTYVAQCIAVLQQEILDLTQQRVIAPPDRRPVLTASINLRRLAGKLLDEGDRAAEEEAKPSRT